MSKFRAIWCIISDFFDFIVDVWGPSKSLFDTVQCKELNLVHSYKEIHGCVLEY